MEIYSKRFMRKVLSCSVIGLIFILSCGKVEVEVAEEESGDVQWYAKLGFKEDMEQIKKDTQLLTRRLGEGDWEDAEELCAVIKTSFEELNLASDEIPEEFFELNQMFGESLERLLLAAKSKDHSKIEVPLRAFKQSCSYCHRILRKELDRMNMETDFDVALDRLYKNKPYDSE